MFEKLIENRPRLVSFIGAKVVDDTEAFTIPVSLPPPPPEEGSATIISIYKSSTFTPGESFQVKPKVRNDGDDDTLFVRLINTDTGSTLKESTHYTSSGATWEQSWTVIITQETDFHGRVEAGHEE